MSEYSSQNQTFDPDKSFEDYQEEIHEDGGLYEEAVYEDLYRAKTARKHEKKRQKTEKKEEFKKSIGEKVERAGDFAEQSSRKVGGAVLRFVAPFATEYLQRNTSHRRMKQEYEANAKQAKRYKDPIEDLKVAFKHNVESRRSTD